MTRYDRSIEDVSNVVCLEHVNTRVPDQRLATIFYVSGLGLTRDPYLMTGVSNMWINVGRSQFHLPSGPAQVLRGHTALVIPDRAALLSRLETVRAPLLATQFSFSEQATYIDTTCPWGNRIRCYAPGERFGNLMLGIPYVEFEVPPGTVGGIARFYQEILHTAAIVGEDGGQPYVRVAVGAAQHLIFRETTSFATAIRRPPRCHLSCRFLGSLSPPSRARTCQRRKRPAPIPLPGHHGSEQPQGALYTRARGALHAPPSLWPSARQS